MDHSRSSDDSLEHDTFVRECLHGHHHNANRSWDAEPLKAEREGEHHSDSEAAGGSQRSTTVDSALVARQRRRRHDGMHEDPDPFHSSNQRIWEAKHKRQDHRRHLRRSIWHPAGRIAGPSADGDGQEPHDPHVHLREGIVDRLFSCESSDEERQAAETEYRIMKRRREPIKELMDLRKFRDLSHKEDTNLIASLPEPHRFEGWRERMAHAEKVNRSSHEPQHGYYRELYHAFKAHQPGSREWKAVYGRDDELPHAEREVEGSSSFLWPPVLLVNNAGTHRDTQGGTDVTGKLKEVRAVYDGKQDSSNMVVYPATEVGFVDAKLLGRKLRACNENPENLMTVDYRRYKTLRDPLDDDDDDGIGDVADGNSFSDDSAYSRRELQLPGERRRKDNEHAVRLIKRKAGDRKNLHWRLKNPTKLADRDPVKRFCEKWSGCFRLSHKPPPTRTHPWTLTDKQRQTDLRFKEQLQQARLQSSASKKVLQGELSCIEREMRRNNLLWLQDLDAIRERFNGLAADVKKAESSKELDREISVMQMEQEREEEVEAAREEVLKQNAERFDKELLFLQNTKRAENKIESQALVNDWVEEEKVLAGEVAEARRTRKQMRRRLQQKLLDRRNQHMANLGRLTDSDLTHHSDYLNVDGQRRDAADIATDGVTL